MNMLKKKKFPKFKKKLSGFLTDESGKVTKNDVLGLSLGGVLLSSADITLANDAPFPGGTLSHTNVAAGHSSYCSSAHVSQAAISGYSTGGHASGYIAGESFSETKSGGGHVSALVNGSATLTGPSGGHLSGVKAAVPAAHANVTRVGVAQAQGHASGYVGHSSSNFPAVNHSNVDAY